MTILLIALVAVLLAVLLAGALIYLYRRPDDYTLVPNTRTDFEQYTVTTPVGRAVVTKIMDDKGPGYEIETKFRGEGVRVYYVAPSTVAVQNRLRGLVAAHEARREVA